MARDGRGILDLQGVVIRVLADLFVALARVPHVGVVLVDALIKRPLLLGRERRLFGIERVEHDLGLDLHVVVVGEGQDGVGEMEAVALFVVRQTHELRHVAVGDEIEFGHVFQELVAVLDHHQLVAARQPLLAIENCAANARVVAVGPLVRAAEHHDVVQPITAHRVADLLDQFAAADAFHIVEPSQLEPGHLHPSRLDQPADNGGIGQNARLRRLTDNRRQLGRHHPAIARQIPLVERRTPVEPDGRQLAAVADQDQLVVDAAAHKLHQVVEQVA